MPEVAAAMGLAQVERLDFFIDLHLRVAKMYEEIISACNYLIPQQTPDGYLNTYWCYSAKYIRQDVSWYQFRDKYMEFGGDGIYASWALLYDETLFTSKAYKKIAPHYYDQLDFEKGICPVAEEIQPQIMQFVNNYGSIEEAEPKIKALAKTINFFQ